MYDCHLVVIGSGPAGEKAATQAAYFGKRVAVIEREPHLGGACINTGTLPSKTPRETALYLPFVSTGASPIAATPSASLHLEIAGLTTSACCLALAGYRLSRAERARCRSGGCRR